MSKGKQEPIDVLRARLAQLNTEKVGIELDLERDFQEVAERLSENGENADEVIREDQRFWFNELYKYEFCIDELERAIKLIENE